MPSPRDSLRAMVREVPDFPKPGVLFRDISPMLHDGLPLLAAELASLFTAEEWRATRAVAGIEARGFILASLLALHQGKGFIPIRKAGKLPGDTLRRAYDLEYGAAEIEMHPGQGGIIILDDVLATGGTLDAAASLAQQAGFDVVGLGVLINLTSLNRFEWHGMKARAILDYA